MKFKKLASLLIAGAMVFSMAMPVFAFEIEQGNEQEQEQEQEQESNQPSDLSRSLKFKGETNVPTINVDMVTEAKIILNPYGLTVSVNGEDKTDPVLTSTVYVTNHSNCPIDISGSFTPSVEGAAKLVDTAANASKGTQAKPADKNVFLAVVMGNVASNETAIDFGTITGNPTTYRDKMSKATAKTNFGTFGTGATDKSGFYALKTADTAVNFGDANDTNTNKTPYRLGTGNENPTYLGLRVFGLCDKWVSSEWKAEDTVSVAMAMTIVPASNEA
jgi:hypothetical protein